ncbi:MAG: DUF4340 domain-containing protein [Thermodesulfobacteriota bacterium]
MKPKQVLIYLVILAGVAAYVFFGEIKRKEARQAEEKKAAQLLDIDTKDVSGIQLESKERGNVELTKTGDTWVLTAPIKSKADDRAVETYLRTLKDASMVRVIKEQDVNWGDFGISEPELRVTVQAKEKKHTLAFGASNPAKTSKYLRVGESPKLMLVEDTLKNALNKSAFDLRDKSVLAVAEDDVERLLLSEGETTTEIRREGDKKWVMVTPERMKVKTASMERQVRALTALQARDIIDEPKSEGDPYGFEKPVATVQIGGKKRDQKLILGGPKEPPADPRISPARYAKVEGRPMVFVVEGSVAKDLHLDPKQLQDRSVLDYQPSAVEKLEVNLEGTQWVAVKGPNEQWKLEKPAQAGTSESRWVREILWNLKDLEWKTVKKIGPGDVEALHLKDPKLTLVLSLKGKDQPITLKASWNPPPEKKPEAPAPDKEKTAPAEAEKKGQPKVAENEGPPQRETGPPTPLEVNVTVDPTDEKDTAFVVDGVFLQELRGNLAGLSGEKRK